MLCATTPACTNCGRGRCQYCEVYTQGVTGRQTATDSSRPSKRVSTRESISRLTAASARIASPWKKRNRPFAEERDGGSESRDEKSTRADPTPEQNPKTSITPREASPESHDLMRDILEVKEKAALNDQDQDTETVVSTISSATTLVDPGAVEAFSHNIMTYQSLGYLWPQLVRSCDTNERCIHIIERLLRRYSEDLARVRGEYLVSKIPDSQLCLAAARFVRRSRLKIAHKIWNFQVQDLGDLLEQNANGHPSGTDINNLDIDEDNDGQKDDNLIYETIEEILFDTSAIFSLRANIKLIINFWRPMEDSTVYWLSNALNTSIKNTFSSLREPSLSPGHTRLRYTCVSMNETICSLSFNFRLPSKISKLLQRDPMLIIFHCVEEMRT